MSDGNIVNSIGLALDIVGAALIWKFGLPLDISRTGAIHLITEQRDEAEVAQAKKYDRFSSFGFILLVTGFALQIWSNFIAH